MNIEDYIAQGKKIADYKAALGSKWVKVFEGRLYAKFNSFKVELHNNWELLDNEEHIAIRSRWHSFCGFWLGWSVVGSKHDPFADEVMEIYNEVMKERQSVIDEARQHHNRRSKQSGV
jgi:hypothetical protein